MDCNTSRTSIFGVLSATFFSAADRKCPMSETERFMEWIRVDQAKPRCKRDPDELGVEVLIWPRNLPYGSADDVGSTAFYGRRATGKPTFYKYGAEIHGITHWAYMPDGPTELV